MCRITKHLGSGQFGSVDEGIWVNGSQEKYIALKQLQHNSNSQDRVKFLQEAAIMAQFNHINVIKLLGMVQDGDNVSH